MKPDQERVKNLLADTVTLLCKNGLNFRKELRVQGLIGITLDDDDVFIVHINERLASDNDVTVAKETEKEKDVCGNLIISSPVNENTAVLNLNQISDADPDEKLLSNSVLLSVPGSCRDPSELTEDSDVACTIVKIEKAENVSMSDQGPYDKMVDFASFLPDFSSARYATDLSAMQHGNLALPGLATASEGSRCTKPKRTSALSLDFLSKSSGGECPDGGLMNETHSNVTSMAYPGGHGLIRRGCASSLGNNAELLLDQNAMDIATGLIDEYSRARGTAPAYFDTGVECNSQTTQGFDSQQLMSLNYRWKRRSQHSLEKPFHCSVPGCSRSYWNMPDLYRHRKMNHGICGRSQARKKAEQDLLNSRSQ